MTRKKSKKLFFFTLMLCVVAPFFLYLSLQSKNSSETQHSQFIEPSDIQRNDEPNVIYLNENYDYTNQLNMTDFSCNVFTT